MSRLRAKCPDCRTYTAVALGPEYECHACGREWRGGLVRVPRAWGDGGETMEAAAYLPLDHPEAVVVEEETLVLQTLALAADLPDVPLILGGCCCAHIGAVEGLAARYDRLALLWFDAHGDLNTPGTSPSGNTWGMPLRMILDSGAVEPERTALIGARNLDAPEEEFLRDTPVRRDPFDALADTDCAYVAFDVDVLEPEGPWMFMPEPGGLRLDEAAALLQRVEGEARIAGIGFTGATPEALPVVERLVSAAGL